jgi:hypothetical protein
LLVVIGLVKIFQSSAGGGPVQAAPPPGVVTGEVQSSSYPEAKPEVKNG